jgi:hypothetical protein
MTLKIIIDSVYFLPMLGLSFMVALVYANSRLVDETIAWMEKEEQLLVRKSYIKYYFLLAVRSLCMAVFFTSAKEISDTIKCWRDNGKIVF